MSGKRITDCTAQTGCRATKWLDLSRMVVGLIFKVYQPLFCLSVYFYRNDDTAGIDLVRFFLIVEFAFFFQLDKVPKKYAGLDGTEIAISESQ